MAADPRKLRLDQLVLERGLAPSREQAQALILAGQILVNGQKAAKPGHSVAGDSELARVGESPRFASRAGLKLEAALDYFKIEVAGKIALDVGSSTGGFTDCLLARGARRVHAVDSGTNQMIWRLRGDPRVHLLEQTNARHLRLADLGERAALLTVDVSFISVTLLLPALLPLLESPADVVILVKPQFEAGREGVGKGGIVRAPEVRQAALERVQSALAAAGAQNLASIPSPLLGARGNQEFLLHATLPPAGVAPFTPRAKPAREGGEIPQDGPPPTKEAARPRRGAAPARGEGAPVPALRQSGARGAAAQGPAPII